MIRPSLVSLVHKQVKKGDRPLGCWVWLEQWKTWPSHKFRSDTIQNLSDLEIDLSRWLKSDGVAAPPPQYMNFLLLFNRNQTYAQLNGLKLANAVSCYFTHGFHQSSQFPLSNVPYIQPVFHSLWAQKYYFWLAVLWVWLLDKHTDDLFFICMYRYGNTQTFAITMITLWT